MAWTEIITNNFFLTEINNYLSKKYNFSAPLSDVKIEIVHILPRWWNNHKREKANKSYINLYAWRLKTDFEHIGTNQKPKESFKITKL